MFSVVDLTFLRILVHLLDDGRVSLGFVSFQTFHKLEDALLHLVHFLDFLSLILDPLVDVGVGLVDLLLDGFELIGPPLLLPVESLSEACCLIFNCCLNRCDLVLEGLFLRAVLVWGDYEDVVCF